jgi:hypothetical protein
MSEEEKRTSPPVNPATAEWERQRGYDAHGAPDGGPGRMGGPGRDPALRSRPPEKDKP